MNRSAPASVFASRVLRVLQRIPPGRVATYGDVAAMAGRPGAARAVGNIMRLARIPGLPYHRVVAAGGRVGGYGPNPQLKVDLLRAEGLLIVRRRIRHFSKVRLRRGPGPDFSRKMGPAPSKATRGSRDTV